jgi:hypothetical protein
MINPAATPPMARAVDQPPGALESARLVPSGVPVRWIRTIEQATNLPHKTLCEL